VEYVNKWYDQLGQEGSYIGLWPDGGNVYLDVTKVFNNEQEAIQSAIKAQQIGIYDLAKNQTKYSRDYQQTSGGAYQYKGENKGASNTGVDSGSSQGRNPEIVVTQTDAYSATPTTGSAVPDTNRVVIVSSPTNLDIVRQTKIAKSLTNEQVSSYLATKAKTAAAFDEFRGKYDKVVNDLGLGKQQFPANRKSDARAIEKAVDDYGGDFSKVKDMNRGAYTVQKSRGYWQL
jgi:hypothetical protein